MKFSKKPAVIEAITFDELVAHGIDSGCPCYDGMPWSFSYLGFPITHENDDCYLIPTPNGTAKLMRGDMLCSQEVDGKMDIWPVVKGIFEMTYEKVDE